MHRILRFVPGLDLLIWLAPVGRATRLILNTYNIQSIRALRWGEFRHHCKWMGHDSFHFIAFSSVFIAIALTIQCVIELHKYQAVDISGAAISIGLLREMGPLTISVAWCARVSARISEEARNNRAKWSSDKEFAQNFVLIRMLAALATSVPLGAYGLVIGFVTAALYAPIIGVNSTIDFAESARGAIGDTDIFVYFLKLIAINPAVGVIAGCSAGLGAKDKEMPVAAKAVTYTFLGCYALNLAVTMSAFLEGAPRL